MEKVQHLKISLEKILIATKNFDQDNLMGKVGFGSVYKGELSLAAGPITVTVKRLDPELKLGSPKFLTEITLLSTYRHKNLVSLVGFCDEDGEKVIVYEHESRGSLDNHIQNPNLTWIQRLKISIGAARGLDYLHDGAKEQYRVLHGDIKSANIVINKEWEAKISDYGLSKIGPSYGVGTIGYLDPAYYNTGILTLGSDIYSFGVVLFEIMCGRLACVEGTEAGRMFLGSLAKHKYKENNLDEIIIPELKKEMNLHSLNTYSAIAYQCLTADRTKRPTMAQIIKELENAFEHQAFVKIAKTVRVGIWGTRSFVGPQNGWSFQLERDHHLKKITIDHGNGIYSMIFTTEFQGVEQTTGKVGGLNGGDIVSEVTLDFDEEIVGISGMIGTSPGHKIISSLTFITNKETHGPYGSATGTPFAVPWEKGSFAGFYGFAGYCIDGIGLYLKDANYI